MNVFSIMILLINSTQHSPLENENYSAGQDTPYLLWNLKVH